MIHTKDLQGDASEVLFSCIINILVPHPMLGMTIIAT